MLRRTIILTLAATAAFVPQGRTAGYADKVIADGPIAYYRFNDAPPTAVNRGSLGPAANGTYNGGATSGAEAPRPPAFVGFEANNTALQLNGSDAFVSTVSGLMNSRPVFTVTGWMRRNGDQPNRTGLWGQNDLVEFGYINNNTLEVWTDNGLDLTPNPIPNGEWAHLAFVSDGSPGTMSLYTNGVLSISRAHSLPGDNSFGFNIGGGGVFDGTGNFFNGQIDEVAVFDKALTADQIAAQYGAAFVNPVITFDDCTLPTGWQLFGVAHIADDGSGNNCVLHMTDAGQASAFGVAQIPDLVAGNNIDHIHVSWRSFLGGGNGGGADGYSFNWSATLPNPPAYGNPGEEGASTGLSVTVDTFDNGGGETGTEIRWEGQRLSFAPVNKDNGGNNIFLRKNTFVTADVSVDVAGNVVFDYDGIVTTATIPGWTGIAGGSFMFGARTGGADDNQWIDNVLIEAFSPGRPFLTKEPVDADILQGRTATFSGVADGSPPLAYQWLIKKATDADFTEIPGATSPSYTTPPAVFPDDNNTQFKLRVSNDIGSTESHIVTLHVAADSTAPTLVSAVGSASMDKATVVFSELYELTTADDVVNYQILDSNNSPLNLLDAQTNVDGLSVTLLIDGTTTPLLPGQIYKIVVNQVADLAGNTVAQDSSITFTSFILGDCNSVIFEAYDTGGGNTVDLLTSHPSYPNNPRDVFYISAMDTRLGYPDDSHEGYGGRLRGLFIPPITGDWFFYLKSDDSSQLFMNTNGPAKAGAVKVAEEAGCCNGFSAHRTAPFRLQAGQGYYLEVLYKEGTGGDYAQVAAKLTTDPTDPDTLAPIPGTSLGIPAAPGGVVGSIVLITPPADQTVEQNRSATFTVVASNPSELFCYQWALNGADIPGANRSSYTTPLAQLADDGAVYSVKVGLIGAPSVSASAVLHVSRDTTAPACLGASPLQNLSQFILTFSEGMDPLSVGIPGNYGNVGGFAVAGATLDASQTRATVTVAGILTPGTTYSVTVHDVTDLAGNVLSPNPTTVSFQTWKLRTGVALRQFYNGIGGVAINAMTGDRRYPDSPDTSNFAEMLEGPIDNQMQDGTGIFDNYGERISGFLIPPVNGNYNFYIASDDLSEFWLSTDANPANKVMLCREPQWTGIRNWTDSASGRRNGAAPENQSVTLFPGGIPLTAGQLYYFETLHKEGGGGDNVDVTWQTPADGPSPDIPINSSTGDASLGDGGTKSIPGRYLATLVPPDFDTTPPNVLSVKQLCPRNRFVITFDEIIPARLAEDINNYAIPAANISTATLRPDQRSVEIITFEDVALCSSITINNITDSVGNPLGTKTVPITTVGAYLASGPQNLIVVEAEHFDDIERQPGLQPWTLETSLPGYSGDGWAEVPVDGFRRFHGNVPGEFVGFGARADYCVNFPVAGTYYIWVRGSTPDGSHNSFHMGLDGVSPSENTRRLGNAINNWGGDATSFGWHNNANAAPASVDVATPGVHTINIWPREDGTRVDKFLFTTDSTFSLAGTVLGPAESDRELSLIARFLDIQRGAGTVTLHFATRACVRYQIQFKNNLTDANWTDLGTPITGDGTTVTITDPAAGSAQRFYRALGSQ